MRAPALRPRRPAFSLMLLALATACVPAGADRVESSDDALIDGVLTEDRPEIGRIRMNGGSACTATLVRPNVVLTAAHCVGYASVDAGDHGSFTIDLNPFEARSYRIERFVSLGTTTGPSDLALLRLAEPVPPSVARPTTIAEQGPATGDPVTIFGYGCTNRSTREGSFRKRRLSFPWAESANLCPGDSGGPVVHGEAGAVWGVNSAFYVGSGLDVFARPDVNRARLIAQIEAWRSQLGDPQPPAELRLSNRTGAGLWARCDGAEGDGCSGWTFLDPGDTAALVTRDRRVVLDNRDLLPSAPFAARRAQAPSDDASVYANLADPFTPPPAPPETEPTPPESQPTPPESQPTPPETEPPPSEPTPPEPRPAPSCLGAEDAATATTAPSDARGRVCSGRASWFAIPLAAGDSLDVELRFSHAAGDIDVRLFDPSGVQVGVSNGTSDVERIQYPASVGGRFTLQVEGWRGASNEVELRVRVSPRPPPPQTEPPPAADQDGDGVPDAIDRCRDTPAGAAIWRSGEWMGCAGGQRVDPPSGSGDADGDGVPDQRDLCSGTPRGAAVWQSGAWAGCAGGQRRDR